MTYNFFLKRNNVSIFKLRYERLVILPPRSNSINDMFTYLKLNLTMFNFFIYYLSPVNPKICINLCNAPNLISVNKSSIGLNIYIHYFEGHVLEFEMVDESEVEY
jgi:hypothetical protein